MVKWDERLFFQVEILFLNENYTREFTNGGTLVVQVTRGLKPEQDNVAETGGTVYRAETGTWILQSVSQSDGS